MILKNLDGIISINSIMHQHNCNKETARKAIEEYLHKQTLWNDKILNISQSDKNIIIHITTDKMSHLLKITLVNGISSKNFKNIIGDKLNGSISCRGNQISFPIDNDYVVKKYEHKQTLTKEELFEKVMASSFMYGMSYYFSYDEIILNDFDLYDKQYFLFLK